MHLFTLHPEAPLNSIVRRMWVLEEEHPFDVQVRSFPVGYPFINVLSKSQFAIDFAGKELVTSSYLAGSNLPEGPLMCLKPNWIPVWATSVFSGIRKGIGSGFFR
jgi:hypothetical protein